MAPVSQELEPPANPGRFTVPLSEAAITLVSEAIKMAGNSAYLFPSGSECKTPYIDPHGLSSAMSSVTKRLKIPDLRLHDGRSACRTWLRDEGIDESVLDAILGHVGRTVGQRHYTATSSAFIERRVRPALDSWADYVMKTVGDGVPVAAL